MTFEEYQKLTRQTAVYPGKGRNFVYPTLGLAGESGEVAEKIKKIFRDNKGVVDKRVKEGIHKELGDVLWYIAQIASELDISLDSIATENIHKLSSRQQRGTLHGNGDNR